MWGLLDCLPWKEPKPISGTVVLITKKVLELSDFHASLLDKGHELLGDHDGISFQLVSSTIVDPSTGKGKLGKETNLESQKTTLTSLAAGELVYKTEFEWDTKFGIPGAVIVKNHHHSEFFLKTVTVEDLPKKGKVHFVCNSWVYPEYPYDRVFFSNDTYLPSKMPAPLKTYRDQELVNLRGDNVRGAEELKESDRVYDYATYNDLSNPAEAEKVRPILGGPEHPYPRRGRTSRPHTKEDKMLESRESLSDSLHIYVPRDERFGHLKMSDFLADSVKSIGQALFPATHSIFDRTPNEFDSFEDTLNLYDGGIPLPHLGFLEELRKAIPFEFIKEWTRTDGAHAFRLPLPDVLKKDKLAWGSDEEFGREMLAGVNPVLIRRLKFEEFPPTSKLDKSVYGDHTSTITAEHIKKSLEGRSVDTALNGNRLFILDHHDHFIPYLPRINALEGNYIYATRTLLFLKDDGTLKPVAIELSQVHKDGFKHGPVSTVYTPPPASASQKDVESSIWQLAKAYVAVNDSGFHQLISHWLNTHAVIEPFIIATHRQLSVTHPIHKLMSPHYRDTMNINALARQILINAGGIFERTVFPQKYALTMSSDVYRSWNLNEQGLPADLIKRGIAVEDPTSSNKLRLLIKDYPYAVDGLAVWSAIESWVNEYCSIYYPSDHTVKQDTELQAWWAEVRERGHEDLKDEPWWPKMHTFKELTKTLTTIIWIASALHAAVNFGQYPYAGYMPNRPTVSRRPMPKPGTKEYEELEKNPEKAFLETITSRLQTLLGISLLEILSRHSSDEIYLGQRDTPEWTSDAKALAAFKRFSESLIGIEEKIKKMNENEGLKNRTGPVKFPYTLLYPNTSDTSGTGGLVPKGIPNSVSI